MALEAVAFATVELARQVARFAKGVGVGHIDSRSAPWPCLASRGARDHQHRNQEAGREAEEGGLLKLSGAIRTQLATGAIQEIDDPSERRRLRLQAEIESRADQDLEVVVLLAASLEVPKQTHARCFGEAESLVKALALSR